MTAAFGSKWLLSPSANVESKNNQCFSPQKLGILLDSGGYGGGALHFERKGQAFGVCTCKSVNMKPVSSVKAMEKRRTVCLDKRMEEEKSGGSLKEFESLKSKNGSLGVSDQDTICSTKTWILYKNTVHGIDKRNNRLMISNVGQSTNIVWHECLVGKHDRQKLLQQKGCVIWITGLSGSAISPEKTVACTTDVIPTGEKYFTRTGKSTVACALTHALYCRGKLAYVLDGDNIRHGLNRDLSFRPEDRAENIRRIGEVAKLFADAGVICIASLISPYRRDRDACRALLPDKNFIEVFMDVPLHVCEARDPKGLYKLARAGKIEGFTGIDDPYEPPLNCEISITARDGNCSSPVDMAEQVISFLEENGFLQA